METIHAPGPPETKEARSSSNFLSQDYKEDIPPSTPPSRDGMRGKTADDEERSTSSTPPEPSSAAGDADAEYPGAIRLTFITASLCLGILCTALDGTILSTAVPVITADFHSLNDVGWYASAFLLTTCAFQLVYGKLYTQLGCKWVFLAALGLFELGSLVCALAPSSLALILGRTVTGLGCGGLFCGANMAIVVSVPLRRRAMFLSAAGMTYGIGSVAGPLVGGALTDHVSWRWCFWINLPIGALTAIVFVLSYRQKRPSSTGPRKTWLARILHFDPVGTALFVPAIICLLLALQWGGTTYPWSSFRPILLLTLAGVLLLAFLAAQALQPAADATLPLALLRNRSVAGGSLFCVTAAGCFFAGVYYIPIYQQAVRGASPLNSGVRTLPLVLAQVLGSLSAAAATTRWGHYGPFVVAAPALLAAGSGMLYTLTPSSPAGVWIGAQVLLGLGVGPAFEAPIVAAQAVLPVSQAPRAVALLLLLQTLGAAVFVSVAQSLFLQRLEAGLPTVQGLTAAQAQAVVSGSSASALRSAVTDPDVLSGVLVQYNAALRRAFELMVILACIAAVGAVAIEWRSVKKPPREEKPQEKKADA